MHLHAATIVDGRDRKRLERVCRYLLRPPFAHDVVHVTVCRKCGGRMPYNPIVAVHLRDRETGVADPVGIAVAEGAALGSRFLDVAKRSCA